jgi:VanZ family protein
MINWLQQRPVRFWGWMYGLWFTVLCILSSMSHPGPHIDVIGIDKVEHCTYFFGGGVALGLALRGKRWVLWIIILTGAAVGWFDEWHQTFTPGRSGLDVYDWIADCVGSLLAALTLPWWRRKFD